MPARPRASAGLRNAKVLLAPARRRRQNPWLLSSPSRSQLCPLATRPRACFKEHRGSRVATMPPSCALAARHPRGCSAGWRRDLFFTRETGGRPPAPSRWLRRWRGAPGAQRSPGAGRAAPGVAGRRRQAPPSPGPGVRAGWGRWRGRRLGRTRRLARDVGAAAMTSPWREVLLESLLGKPRPPAAHSPVGPPCPAGNHDARRAWLSPGRKEGKLGARNRDAYRPLSPSAAEGI